MVIYYIGHVYLRPYVYSFRQIFQALCLFPALRLLRTLEYGLLLYKSPKSWSSLGIPTHIFLAVCMFTYLFVDHVYKPIFLHKFKFELQDIPHSQYIFFAISTIETCQRTCRGPLWLTNLPRFQLNPQSLQQACFSKPWSFLYIYIYTMFIVYPVVISWLDCLI